MEGEETYLELYLARCAAQVSLEAAATVPESGSASRPIAELWVLRTKDSASILSLVKLLATQGGGLDYPRLSVEKNRRFES